MTSIFYTSSCSELTTPSETDIETDTENETESEESEFEECTTSSSSSGALTRSETNDSIEVINPSRLIDGSGIDMLSGLLQRTSLGPKVLKSIESGEQTANNSGVTTPQLFTLEEAAKILAAQKKSKQHENAIKRVKKVLDANTESINSDPKGFGFKFISVCISAAFGGRKGVNRYDENLPEFNIKSVVPQMAGCANFKNELNASLVCLIGHVLLYYWDDELVRSVMCDRFGPLDQVIKGKRNVTREIGGKHLWAPKVHVIKSSRKLRILESYEEKFEKDPENFEEIMMLFGIEL